MSTNSIYCSLRLLRPFNHSDVGMRMLSKRFYTWVKHACPTRQWNQGCLFPKITTFFEVLGYKALEINIRVHKIKFSLSSSLRKISKVCATFQIYSHLYSEISYLNLVIRNTRVRCIKFITRLYMWQKGHMTSWCNNTCFGGISTPDVPVQYTSMQCLITDT